MTGLLLSLPLLLIILVAAGGQLSTSQRRADANSTPSASTFTAPAQSGDLSKKYVNLYGLRIPFQDAEGYATLYISTDTAISFCKDVSDTLYEDSAKVFLVLDVKLHESTMKIPVREGKAIEFCQNLRKNERIEDGTSNSRLSNPPIRIAGPIRVGAISIAGEAGTSTAQPSMESKKKENSMGSKAISATVSQNDTEPSKYGVEVPSDAIGAGDATTTDLTSQAKESNQVVTKPVKSLVESELATSTAFTKSLIQNAGPTSGSVAETSFAKTTEVLSTSLREQDPSDDDNASSTTDGATSGENAEDVPSKSETSAEVSDLGEIPTQTSRKTNRPPYTSVPTSKSESPSPPQTAQERDNLVDPSTTQGAKVSEVGHQKTVPHLTVSSMNTSDDYIDNYMATETVTPRGAAVRAKTWENDGRKRVFPGAGILRRAEFLSRRHDSGKTVATGTERVLAPHRPTLSTNSVQLTSVRKPATSAYYADIVTSHKASAIATGSVKAKMSFSFPDPETISFLFTSPALQPHASKNGQALALPLPYPEPSLHPTWTPSNEKFPSTSSPTSPDHQASLASGKIHDPRMRWTIRFLWVIEAVQMLCGVWEFVKNARGLVHVGVVRRRRWWDGKIGEAR